MDRATGWVGGLLLAAAAVGWLWAGAAGRAPAPPRLPCARAILVDGQLRCDDELPPDVAALCPGSGSEGSEPIAAGDAFDTAQLCARPGAQPGAQPGARPGARSASPSPHTPARGDVPGWSRMPAEELQALQQPVDLNRASIEELQSLPRIGPALARRIVEGRPYDDVDALTRVRGIGPATVARLRSRAFVRSPDLGSAHAVP